MTRADLPPVDRDELLATLVDLLAVPSPTGRTDAAVQLVGDRLRALGLDPQLTRRGAVAVEVRGRSDAPDRAVIAHVDTLGAMVRALLANGRLALAPIGHWSARFAEGGRVTIFTDHLDVTYTGTVLPLKASGHRWGDEVDTAPVGWEHVEVRVDEGVHDAEGLAELGIQVGDHVAFDAQPVVTPAGYVASRHLDDKAGVAVLLAALGVLCRAGADLPVSLHCLFTISEEVGHGASHGLDTDVAELLSIDNAVVAPGQQSREDAVTIASQDLHGPFDYHLVRRLGGLCDELAIPHVRDVFRFYRSDAAAALEAGAATRAVLVGFGVDASHGWERTHLDGLVHLATLVAHYACTDLTLGDWDRTPAGPLVEFPSISVQPAPAQPVAPPPGTERSDAGD